MSPIREEDIQACIVQGLSALSFTVLQTSRRGVRCKCGQKAYGGDGASRGVPDLLVTHKSWPVGVALMLEVKGPKTALSPEQKALEADGRIVVVRSWEEALAAVRGVKWGAALGNPYGKDPYGGGK